MDKIFVKDLVTDGAVDTAFAVKTYSVRKKKNGDDFLSLVLRDASGEIQAVMWDNVAEAKKALEAGSYVWVSGRVGSFNDRKQVTIQRIKPLQADQVDEEDFVAVSQKDLESMFAELRERIDSIGHLHLRNLLIDFIEDEDIASRLQRAPAAMSYHHTYIGGLLDHTLSMMNLAEKIAGHYSLLDRDLLLTGVFLHDLAKTEELLYDNEYKYSESGQLLGHIVLGVLNTDQRMRALEFPEKLRLKVLHMIVSHHGEEQYGSPRKPMLPEAIALHYIDLIDSRMEMAREALERDSAEEGPFTEFSRGLAASLYKG